MPGKSRITADWSAAERFLVAGGIFGVALGLRLAVLPQAYGWAYLTFYPALTLAAVVCGTGPAVLVTLASSFAGYYFFFGPHSALAFKPEGIVATAIFAVTGIGIVWVVRRMHDYAERWQVAAAEAHASERRYLAVIEDMTDLIQRYSSDGRLVFVNDAFCRVIGKPRTELLGSLWSRYPVAEDLPLIEQQNAQLSPANPVVLVEARFKARSGDPRWVQFANRALFDGDGTLREIQSVGRDVTEHKQLELALEQARNAAVQASEFKSRFLAAASHDLRQPLQTIWSLHSVLSRSLGGGTYEAHLGLLEDALRSMDDTLGALMDINRLEKGAIVPVVRDFSLRQMLARLRSEYAFAAAGKGLALDIEDSAESARSDPMLLAVILRNLLGNAIKYTFQGGVSLRVHRDGSRLAIAIADTGIGIPAEHQSRIFDAFYQVDNPAQDQRRGIGLGLSIVQSMCRLLDHEVSIESRVGRGSTFTLYVTRGAEAEADAPAAAEALPAARPARAAPVAAATPVAAGAPAAAAAPPAASRRGGTILHIEDDPGVARSMGLLLGLEGYTIVHAASRIDALREVQQGLRPDLILCDFHLQRGQTGDQVVAELAGVLERKPPTIVLTGDISDRQIEKARVIADRILPKPVDIDLLLREFDALLVVPPFPAAAAEAKMDASEHNPENGPARGPASAGSAA